MSFREDVSEIVSIDCNVPRAVRTETCAKYADGGVFLCFQCRTDRIIAAHNAELERIEKGMERERFTSKDVQWELAANSADFLQLKTDQEHVRKEKCQ